MELPELVYVMLVDIPVVQMMLMAVKLIDVTFNGDTMPLELRQWRDFLIRIQNSSPS
jgi:hypothetical protein